MNLRDVNDNEDFIIEEIDAPENEIATLATLGIRKGVQFKVIRDGYFDGSKIILLNDTLVQLQGYFIDKINGSIIDKKDMVKKLKF